MRLILPAALLLATVAAALADGNPTFDPGHDLRVDLPAGLRQQGW